MKSIRGTADLLGRKYQTHATLRSTFEQHMISYGFEGIEPALLEHASLYHDTAGGTSDIVSKEMFVVNSLSSILEGHSHDFDTVLRPEGTVSCIRAIIAAGRIDDAILRLYYSSAMFRYNRPQHGRLRQFTQMGCELLNQNDPYVDAEVLQCLVSLFDKLRVPFKLHINTVGSGESRVVYRQKLYDFFKSKEHVLSEQNRRRLDVNVMRVLDQLSSDEKELLADGFPSILDLLSAPERDRFEKLCNTLINLGISFVLDNYLVRGLDYYKDTVFELIHQNHAIAAGGCYTFDKKKFGIRSGGETYGIGWAIGLERIEGLATVVEPKVTLSVIYAVDPIYALEVLRITTAHNHRSILLRGDMKSCIKRAASINAEYIIICHESGAKDKTVKLRSKNSESIVTIEQLLFTLGANLA